MPDWQFGAGLSIALLVAFTAHVFYPILIHTQKAIIFPNLSCIALLVLMLEAKAHFRFSH